MNPFTYLDRRQAGGYAVVKPSEDRPGEYLGREDGGGWAPLEDRHIRKMPTAGTGLATGARTFHQPVDVGDGHCLFLYDLSGPRPDLIEVINLLTPLYVRVVGY